MLIFHAYIFEDDRKRKAMMYPEDCHQNQLMLLEISCEGKMAMYLMDTLQGLGFPGC